ncbi:phosphocholine-specific phospholipase C [Dyadobacter tibetensis]|uniref:phosphocholine-specific phospholipase C n=1 Tax=Dyadobacter tibetensis TaxID=1211851 RepID=UPI00046EFCF0|nr:phospholipase C, phosphocholine-specific [Dyadobacter tibetensis]
MESRREFIRKATLLTGAAGMMGSIPESIKKALAIDPAPGSTYLDAEHIVVLMQENRSFDHAYGSLQGVRGFNDPRTIRLPNGNLAWMQTDAFGATHVPFRLNMRASNATWMGSLPHSWTDQVDARNKGLYDNWLIAKQPGNSLYKHMPLAQGYYNREDIPFYYALADAFTVGDQNFCSAMTGTTPNRLYLWTGTIRETPSTESYANVRNENVNDEREASWKTFPERLEDAGIPWRIYQNELSIRTGFEGEEEEWLANFTDSPLEWFKQYNIRYHTGYQNYISKKLTELRKEISEIRAELRAVNKDESSAKKLRKSLEDKNLLVEFLQAEQKEWSAENFNKLTEYQKSIHRRAYTTNINDPDYRRITTVQYHDGDIIREAKAPQGDILHQFRTDVNNDRLPTVSWLVAPENFSDHPTSPWYGAWYVSEVMDILTKNPEIWKKTIFILCYDENDGYFDHVPPYVVPNPYKSDSGKVSDGIDCKTDYVTKEQDMRQKEESQSRESPIGLGYRVPLVLASPWNRGGKVFSQISDHTSILQFMEHFLTHKTGKQIKEENISEWRRTICSDLTASFSPYDGKKIALPGFLDRNEFMEGIHNAQFKKLPSGFKALTEEEIKLANQAPHKSKVLPQQEPGIRPSCALPYELYADGSFKTDLNAFQISFKAGNDMHGAKSSGSPFIVYARNFEADPDQTVRNYAVRAGDSLQDQWPLNSFQNQNYDLEVNGPNGFYRQYKGEKSGITPDILCRYAKDQAGKFTGDLILEIKPVTGQPKFTVKIRDNAYNTKTLSKIIDPKTLHEGSVTVKLDLQKNHYWYDITVTIEGNSSFSQRYAGRVDCGRESMTDPFMGRMV